MAVVFMWTGGRGYSNCETTVKCLCTRKPRWNPRIFDKVLLSAGSDSGVRLINLEGQEMFRIACALVDERRDYVLHPFFEHWGFRSWSRHNYALSADSLKQQRLPRDAR